MPLSVFRSTSILLLLTAILAACGGGSSSSGSGIPPLQPTPPGSGVHTIYPWRHAVTPQADISLHGIAWDPNGVAQVTVNNEPATLVPVGTDPALPANSVVRWSLPVQLEQGENSYLARVENALGMIYVENVHTRVHLRKVPSWFLLDTSRSRLVGQSTSSEFSQYPEMMTYDYANHHYELRPETPFLHCLRSDHNEGLSLLQLEDGSYQILGVDLDTQVTTRTISVPASLTTLAVGPDVNLYHWPTRLLCESGSTTGYVYIGVSTPHEAEPTSVIRLASVDLNSGEFNLIREGFSPDLFIWFPLVLEQGRLFALADYYAPLNERWLREIDTSTGAETTLASGTSIRGENLIVGPAADTFYFIANTSLYRLRPDQEPALTTVVSDLIPATSQPAMAYEPNISRLLIGAHGRVLAVDTSTGNTEALATQGRGTGPYFYRPRALAITTVDSFVSGGAAAYIHERTPLNQPRLIEVDLGSGNRRQVAHNFPLPGPVSSLRDYEADALTVDAAGQYAYLGFRQGIVRVDIQSGSADVLSRPTEIGNLLTDVISLVLDETGNRLLVADQALDAIVALDLDTYAQSVFSKLGERGLGEDFHALRALAISDHGIYALNNGTGLLGGGSILLVNRVTGDRTLVTDGCGSHDADGLAFDPLANELLTQGNWLQGFSLHNLQCRVLYPYSFSLRDLVVTPNGAWLGAHYSRGLVQLDPTSNAFVVISH